jgi:L-aminopeptidase/D-esterase-like protein
MPVPASHPYASERIKGFEIGHATDAAGGTGVTVVLAPAGATSGVAVRGGAPATRETDLLDPGNLCPTINAVVLSGGSAYGLDAAGGVMAYLEERGIGFDVGVGIVPIVCGASLFDLGCGNPHARPDSAMGRAACEDAERRARLVVAGTEPRTTLIPEGNVGAGTGATVGKILGPSHAMKSGIGSYGLEVGSLQVGVVVAVNALGDITNPSGEPLAGLLGDDHHTPASTEEVLIDRQLSCLSAVSFSDVGGHASNTTLAVVLTNAKLTKAQASKVSSIAHDGFARSIRPVHTLNDGDTIFTMATGEIDASFDTVALMAANIV